MLVSPRVRQAEGPPSPRRLLSPSPRPRPKAPPVTTAHAGFPQGFQLLLRSTGLSKRASAPRAGRRRDARHPGGSIRRDRPERGASGGVRPGRCFLHVLRSVGPSGSLISQESRGRPAGFDSILTTRQPIRFADLSGFPGQAGRSLRLQSYDPPGRPVRSCLRGLEPGRPIDAGGVLGGGILGRRGDARSIESVAGGQLLL